MQENAGRPVSMDNILCLMGSIAWPQVGDREGLRQGGDRIPGGAGNVVVGGGGGNTINLRLQGCSLSAGAVRDSRWCGTRTVLRIGSR